MKIVFFGSAEFAVPSLAALFDAGYQVCCVVTQPDRKKGRGLRPQATPVKALAVKHGLKIYQPEKINLPAVINLLKQESADLFIVVAYGHILSQEILALPRVFALNLHASLLPKYRGAAPINWALINGESKTGVTLIKMTEKMDAGEILFQEEVAVDDGDNALTLEEKLSFLGTKLLVKSLKAVEDNNYFLSAQDSSAASLAPKLKKEDGLIRWEKPAEEIHNLIRGCLGWPGAFTYYQGQPLKIYASQVIRPSGDQAISSSGEIAGVSKAGLSVTTGKDLLCINELQLAGKRRMSVEEFIAGHQIKPGERLG